jgi:multidrug efflux system membrane fusion protein
LHGQTVIPASAIQHGSDGAFVFVVNPDKTASQRTVTVGTQDGENADILSGIKPGDTVVVDGADRLRDGAEIAIPNAKTASIAAPSAAQPGSDPQAALRDAQRAKRAAAMQKVCGDDIKKFCGGDKPGRALFTCLRQHSDDLSDTCKAGLAKARGGRRGGGGFGGAP